MPEGHVELDEDEYVSLLEVFWCSDCLMVQTQTDLDLSDYYFDYAYTTGASSHVQNYMKNFCDILDDQFNIAPDGLVLEVGSGDGVQLSFFKQIGCQVLGVEPSEALADAAEKLGVSTMVRLFDDDAARDIQQQFGKAKAILIQYTFDHLQDPAAFIKSVNELLEDEGILVIEVHDFELIFERNEACLFTHEHSVYPSFESLARLMELNSMKIIARDFVDDDLRRGNSIIVVAAKETHPSPSIADSTSDTLQLLRSWPAYSAFSENIELAHKNLKNYIVNRKNSGARLAGYGAAGRGVDTMVLAGITGDHLDCIYDMNKAFHGKLTPVSRVVVKQPEDLFEDCPDELIVFSYGYVDEIKELYKRTPVKITSLLDILKGEI